MYVMIVLLLGSVLVGFAARMSHGAQSRLAFCAALLATVLYVVWAGAM